MTDGLVVVDKPAGWTSHDVVARLRKIYGQRRVGHAGTLDPDATGVLLVGLGRVTRLLRFLQAAGKTYRAVVSFGVSTDTLDAAGTVVEQAPMPLERHDVEAAAARFLGRIEQVPPMVSAVKIAGRRLYEAARRGEEVERPARPVEVSRFEVVDFEPGDFPMATAVVDCSSGTYVRSLAADLGASLGGRAHLASLRRLSVGSFGLDEARTLDQIEEDPAAAVLTPVEALRDLSRVEVDAEQARAVSHGAVFPADELVPAGGPEGPLAVVAPDGSLLAVYEHRDTRLKPAVVGAAAGGGDAPRTTDGDA